MSGDSFVHLHNHTQFSMLDGLAQVKELAKEAARQQMPALAQTDHGVMFGSYAFWKACRDEGINPIIGMEGYLTPKTRRDDRTRVKWGSGGENDVSGGGAYTHLTMLAETTQGMHNLFKIASYASLEGFFYKPRADRDLLQRYGKGIIATTGCPSGEVQTYLRMGKYEQARESAAEFRDLFGDGNYFVELMDHGLDIERRATEGLLQLSKDLNLPVLATNDLHYTHAADASAHEALLCVQSGKTLDDPKRFKFDAQDFYLKPAQEMRHLWRDHPQACDNTLLVAERCHVDFPEGSNLMPHFPVPDGETEESWLRREVQAGLARRYPDGVPEDRQAQADYEVGIIVQMNFPGYFLVVADYINWAKQQGHLVGPGRGSGAGSIVAYALGITDLDPMVHGLLFERFLNPERVSMPDFDVDFDEVARGEVIRYVTDKYGADRVAQIVTFGTIKAKAAVKDSARILGYPFGAGEKITKVFPAPVMGKDMPLQAVFDPEHKRYSEAGEVRALYEGDPDSRKIIDTARGLEGATRQWGVHAAGVIMSAEPLMDHIPIMKREADGAIITQFEYPICESLGMVKMDFLGLSNLNTVQDAVANIKANRGITVDLDHLTNTLDDPKTYELLARGDTLGVFQLDGGPMRDLLKSMRPDNFEDISAVIALYRPGPMGANSHNEYADRKTGRKPVIPIHPDLAEALSDLLSDTYGLIVYQEQVMAIAQKLAGYSLGAADLLRRAMGKKKKEILDKEYVPFRDGMKSNGYSDAAIQTLWDILVPFSDYAFNKAHSAAYGVISYWTAYLKANYPAEYMAALLTTNADNKDKTAIYLAECRRMGIRVLSPDVNDSIAPYAAVGEDIRVGLAAIRNVGHHVVDSIVTTRTNKDRYTSFPDFLAKSEQVVCNKRAVESLIKAGAFDSLGHTRRALYNVHVEAIDAFASQKKNEAKGQDSLFGALDDDSNQNLGSLAITVPDTEEWEQRILLAFEREQLGLYVSDHPLSRVGDTLAAQADTSVTELLDGRRPVDTTVTLGGLVTNVQRKTTKGGDAMAIVTIEDRTGELDVVCFPRTYNLVGHMLSPDAILLVVGQFKRRDDGSPQLIVDDLKEPDLAMDPRDAKPLVLYVAPQRLTSESVPKIQATLKAHPGDRLIHMHVVSADAVKVFALGDEYRITYSPALVTDLKEVLGPNVLTGPPKTT